MEEKKREVSFVVFIGFILLFLLFLFLSPQTENTSRAVIGSSVLGESPSIVTLVIMFVILIAVLSVVFIIFKKIKKKKGGKLISPKSEEVKQGVKPMEDSQQKPVEKSKKEEKGGLEGEDIDQLFSEGGMKQESKVESKPVEKPQLTQPVQKPTPKKEVMTSLTDLKNKVQGMLSQKFTKEQIVSNLKSQGVTQDQVTKVFEEVNLDNLRTFVNNALKQGFTRDQIVRNLVAHGWKQEQINKVI